MTWQQQQQQHISNTIPTSTALTVALPRIRSSTSSFLQAMLIPSMSIKLADCINYSSMPLFNSSKRCITNKCWHTSNTIMPSISSIPCRPVKAERRAEHNAIERARRENLNTKFQQLAHSLPNLQNDRRPSKGTIIERTLDFVKNTVMKEEKFLSEIRKLREEHEDLMRQLTPGPPSNGSASDADESDGSSTTSRGVFAVDRLSLNSSSCPSLELSSTSPSLQASSGLDSSGFMPSTTSYGNLLSSNPVHNDVMFGQHDPQHHQSLLLSSAAATYESDDDYSSANLDEIDHTVTDLTCK
ncbi:hypothetical protein BDB00DRAFT_401672 [Zychaea mexicana]|uniref:uncharacterized protein n=1 Tax=Zychaea mexicana TaxID=64656 RepID=UPI0022FF2641|nr:uncharacterized protein BDB00DRAFT_401672 [Zychaea mexicana]KAI9498749.1 hypothetical protein BDB00DRAFT_401672 [Zychaea mexicana]